jgi:hypothetical protein
MFKAFSQELDRIARSHRDTQLSAGWVEGDPIRSRPRTFSKGNSNPATASS